MFATSANHPHLFVPSGQEESSNSMHHIKLVRKYKNECKGNSCHLEHGSCQQQVRLVGNMKKIAGSGWMCMLMRQSTHIFLV